MHRGNIQLINYFGLFLLVTALYACDSGNDFVPKNDPPPKAVVIESITVGNIPEFDNLGSPWDLDSNADIMMSLSPMGGGAWILRSDTIQDIDYGKSYNIPMDSVIRIEQPEQSFWYALEDWDALLGPTPIRLGSIRFFQGDLSKKTIKANTDVLIEFEVRYEE